MAFQRKKPAAIGVKAPLPGFIEPALATSIEKVPSGRAMDSRNQVRRLPGPGAFGQRGGQDLHPARPRLDAPLQEGRPRCLAHQGELRRHRRRDRRPRRRRHDRFLGAAERAQGQVDQDRAGGVRSALSEWPRSSEAAADPEEGRTEEDRRWHRRPVQRKLRDRGPRDVRARLQARPGRRRLEGARRSLSEGP